MANNTIPKVSIVLLNLNGYNDSRDCLQSLEQLDYENFEVIMVDNGSSDDSATRLAQEFPDVTLLRSQQNLGFTGGNNLGMEMALRHDAAYVLLLNNDTVVEPAFLTFLVKVGETDPEIGILGPKIYYASDKKRIWYAGGRVKYGACHHRGIGELDNDGEFSYVEDTGFISGCALLVKSIVLREVGLLDNKLFVYHEDTDFCMRARKAGYRCVFVPDALIWHKISRTCGHESAFTLYLSTRNQLTWVANHVAPPYKPAALAFTFAKKIAKMLLVGFRNRSSGAAVWAGMWAFLRGVYGPPRNGWMPRNQTVGTEQLDVANNNSNEPSFTKLSTL
jgi:GT2 family glycosyltransferase